MVTLHTIINNHNYIRYYIEQRDLLSVGQHLMGTHGLASQAFVSVAHVVGVTL